MSSKIPTSHDAFKIIANAVPMPPKTRSAHLCIDVDGAPSVNINSYATYQEVAAWAKALKSTGCTMMVYIVDPNQVVHDTSVVDVVAPVVTSITSDPVSLDGEHPESSETTHDPIAEQVNQYDHGSQSMARPDHEQ